MFLGGVNRVQVIQNNTQQARFGKGFANTRIKLNNIIDAFTYHGPGGGSQFEGNPLPSSRLGSSWPNVSIFLGCLLPGIIYRLILVYI